MLSITISLVAVFIPILFMGGIVGRFFFEFAMTISIAILLSGFISLTLTPMLASRMLKHRHAGEEEKPGLLSRAFEKGYDLMARGYRVTLDASLRVPWLMWLLTLGTVVATVFAFGIVKKGFLPTEDTSIIIVRTEAAPDIAFQAMLDRQRIVSDRIRADPDVLYVNSNVQQTFFNPTLNRGSIFVQLKPRRDAAGAGHHQRRAEPPAPQPGGHPGHPRLPRAAAEPAHRQPRRRGALSIHADQRRPGRALRERAAPDRSRRSRRRASPTSPAT